DAGALVEQDAVLGLRPDIRLDVLLACDHHGSAGIALDRGVLAQAGGEQCRAGHDQRGGDHERDERARERALAVADALQGQEQHQRSSTRAMRPSARCTTRSAWLAAAGSCVTMTSVWPVSSTSSRSSARTSALVLVSRAPVGSSANTTSGRPASARAIAT